MSQTPKYKQAKPPALDLKGLHLNNTQTGHPATVATVQTAPITDSESLNSASNATFTYSTPTPSAMSTQAQQTLDSDDAYLKLHISPGSMLLRFDEVTDLMANDKIFEYEFAQDNMLVKRLLHFLYGRKYYCSKTIAERISSMKRCVDSSTGNRERLRRVAFSAAGDVALFTREDAFQEYSNVASVARLYFKERNIGGRPSVFLNESEIIGGFPKEAFLR
jgi:hypothetical protein